MSSFHTAQLHPGPSGPGYEFIDQTIDRSRDKPEKVQSSILITELTGILIAAQKLTRAIDEAFSSINEEMNDIARFVDAASFRLSNIEDETPFFEEAQFDRSFGMLSHEHVTSFKQFEMREPTFFNPSRRISEIQSLLNIADSVPDLSPLSNYLSKLSVSEKSDTTDLFKYFCGGESEFCKKWILAAKQHLKSKNETVGASSSNSNEFAVKNNTNSSAFNYFISSLAIQQLDPIFLSRPISCSSSFLAFKPQTIDGADLPASPINDRNEDDGQMMWEE
eukprot:MONOS_5127.1-p1 / transcript=MONOS_5127.1 / gene=MONOS_5127 / organism=Monocercomonoides_exilis_PA203 / gene_product=unspecified product / transcript_product=unspecified product / location=Mono_scaffold00146:13903-14921(-) / protein_length=278 / sequence_SO=supercontig / SO=protein_coding / is_pseudo=false